MLRHSELTNGHLVQFFLKPGFSGLQLWPGPLGIMVWQLIGAYAMWLHQLPVEKGTSLKLWGAGVSRPNFTRAWQKTCLP